MAAIATIKSIYLCHFCSNQFTERSTLLTHLTQCEKTLHHDQPAETSLIAPKLTRYEKNLLRSVRLRHVNSRQSNKNQRCTLPSDNIHQCLQTPLSNLISQGFILTSSDRLKSSLFSDSTPIVDEFNQADSCSTLTANSTNLSSYHVYKYSRREQRHFNARLKRLILRKNCSTSKIDRTQESPSYIFHAKHLTIDIPTKISSRQRLSSSNNRIFPLAFDNYFPELVKLPLNPIFNSYLNEVKRFFHLIHSIASQEFQYLIVNHDHQHQLSFTTYSLRNIFRQNFLDSTANYKRSFFQTFQDHDHHSHTEQDLTMHSDQDLFIPPLKIRRYDNSSYEIQNRSSSSTTSSSSSGMSITQIHQGQIHSSSDDRHRSKQNSTKFCDQQLNSNHSFNSDLEKKDVSQFSIETNSTLFDQCTHSNDGNSKDVYLSSSISQPYESSTTRKIKSPNVISDLANDNLPKYQSVALNDGARIRIVNCSNDNSKNASVRNHNGSLNKRLSQQIDENWTSKTGRMSTRKSSSTNSKTSNINEISLTYKTQSVILTNSDITHGWSTHSVFYRCHACSHEQFFVVLSRECMNLHVSSKHANMEENFKHRLSNFLNNQGRALKIFQHYLKWQQPWSEKEIDQIFQLSNINSRPHGTL